MMKGLFEKLICKVSFFILCSLPKKIKLYKTKKSSTKSRAFVRMKGLEPPRLTALDPKSSAATNYATSAIAMQISTFIFVMQEQKLFFFEKKLWNLSVYRLFDC